MRALLLYVVCSLGVFAQARVSCLDAIHSARLATLAARQIVPKARTYFPADFHAHESRPLIIYFHGFGQSPEAYERSMRAKIDAIVAAKGLRAPVVLSFSMGPATLAGLEQHAESFDPQFIAPSDFWIGLRSYLAQANFDIENISFWANSGGAFSAFQMLRHRPADIRIQGAVFCSFPNFTADGLAANPSATNGRDMHGTDLRRDLEPVILPLVRRPFFSQLLPEAALEDESLPRDLPILIQAAEWDAFGYTALNERFAATAQARGWPVEYRLVPNAGHGDDYDNAYGIDFLYRANRDEGAAEPR